MLTLCRLFRLTAGAGLLAFALLTQAAAQQTGILTGIVADASSGQTLESAQVYLPNLGLGALTNSEGRFLILNVPVGGPRNQCAVDWV